MSWVGKSPRRIYKAPFDFTGGEIDKVVIDVSGDPFIDHEKEAVAWLMRD